MNSRSQLPAHPGEILSDWIRGKQMSTDDTASLLGVSATQLNRVLSGKECLSPTLAVRLEHIDWGTAESWSGTQTVWDIVQARKCLSLPAKTANTHPRRIIDLGSNIYSKADRRPRALYRPRCMPNNNQGTVPALRRRKTSRIRVGYAHKRDRREKRSDLATRQTNRQSDQPRKRVRHAINPTNFSA